MDMAEPTSLRHGFVPTGSGLINMSLERQDHAEPSEHVRVGINRNGLDRVMRRANKANTSLQDGARGGKFAEVEAGNPLDVAAQNLRRDIVPSLADLVELLR